MNDGELVAAEAGEQIGRARSSWRRRWPTASMQVVAGVVAERIVDLLEAVEIEHQHAGAPLARRPLRQGAGQGGLEVAAVGQAGERIVTRLVFGVGAADLEGVRFPPELMEEHAGDDQMRSGSRWPERAASGATSPGLDDPASIRGR